MHFSFFKSSEPTLCFQVSSGSSWQGSGRCWAAAVRTVSMLTPVELLLLLCRYFHGSELAVPALCCTPLTGLKRTLCEGSLFPSAPCSGLQGPVQLCSHRTAAGWQVLLWPYSGAVGTQLGNALGLTLPPQQQTFEDYISKRRKGRVPQRLRSC